MTGSKTLRLADYRPSSFMTGEVNLDFSIHEDHTIATSKVVYRRNADPQSAGQTATALVLNAQNPNPAGKPYIRKVTVNGVSLTAPGGFVFDEENETLTIPVDPSADNIAVEIETYLEPQNNAKLEGLYQSDNCITTQCESEGFRRITPFLDRPDVMAVYNVRIESDPTHCPVMMANGNKTSEGTLPNGRHFATYNDPWPKPCYLFCTANGKLEAIEDTYTTGSGRKVAVRVFTEAGQSEKGRHALESLKTSMKWDEDVFGCEYDLDNFNIVCVAKFSFGAMENKGLNVFRDSLVLANPDIATDGNYQRITDVIGHEYFHNWSGNRVTLANWFNISLKEGLTVIREQMFTAFTTSEALERIKAIADLRATQFSTDDSPLAHPVMPQEVESIENCYTTTIYEKGAEVIRMMKVMMGEEKWIEGVKHYFATNDGKAVTINEFVASMEKVSGRDFSGQFHLWYTQSGRPRVKAQGVYDAAAQTYTLTLEQTVPPTKDQPVKKPMVLPVLTGLVDGNGADMTVRLAGKEDGEHLLILSQPKQTFVFEGVTSEPAFHSVLRGFSAPVTLDPGLTEKQLLAQMVKDTDGFNRWDAAQKIALAEMKRLYNGYTATGAMPPASRSYLDSFSSTLGSAGKPGADLALIVETLALPGNIELEAVLDKASPSAVAAVRKHLRETIATELAAPLKAVYTTLSTEEKFEFSYAAVGKRALKNMMLGYMTLEAPLPVQQELEHLYITADNMTDRMAVMSAIRNHPGPSREAIFDDFFSRFENDALTIQKWIGMQAMTEGDAVIEILNDLSRRPFFNWENPGHVGSMVGGFIGNYVQFHRPDGKGYQFVADMILKMDDINPKTASRFVNALSRWRSYSEDHQRLMIAALERVADKSKLSPDVREKVFKSLPSEEEKMALGLICAPMPSPSSMRL